MGFFGPSNYDLQRDISRLHVLIVTLLNYLQTSFKTQETRMATLQEYVSDIKAALTEASNEFDAKLDQLAQALASQGQLTPEQEALLDDLRAQARAVLCLDPDGGSASRRRIFGNFDDGCGKLRGQGHA